MCITVSIIINQKISYLHQSTNNSFSYEACFYFLCEKSLECFTKPHGLAAAYLCSLTRLPQHVTFSHSLCALLHQSLRWSFFPQISVPSHPSHLYCSSHLICQYLREVLVIAPKPEPLIQTLLAAFPSPPFYWSQSTILYIHVNVLFRSFCF